jgi:hypothetical protein
MLRIKSASIFSSANVFGIINSDLMNHEYTISSKKYLLFQYIMTDVTNHFNGTNRWGNNIIETGQNG